MLHRLSYTIGIAAEALRHNKLRALLTSLGIVFGVASVIAMLAIGQGAQQEILEQIRILGATNVIVQPVQEKEEGAVTTSGGEGGNVQDDRVPYSPGLTLADAQSIAQTIPGVEAVSPEIVLDVVALRAGRRRSAKLVGVESAYFDDLGFLEGGPFAEAHYDAAMPVCVVGSGARGRFFAGEEALGGLLKVSGQWCRVVGVLAPRGIDQQQLQHLGLRDYDEDVYVPLPAVLRRVRDRARLSERIIREAQDRDEDAPRPNYHQLDRLTVRVAGSAYVGPVAEVVARMLERRHHGVVDYEVVVPEALLAQEQRTQRIFNVVLAAIASISLIVGGIGIMNIMLASVMERIREIGVRRSMGATRDDILLQFLLEAVLIGFTGGVLGILLGVGISLGIEAATDIPTVISPFAVVLSFVVSVSVGLVFGLLPARRAVERDPVEALRHE